VISLFAAHVDNEMYLSRSLERLGGNALSKDQEPDIGAAFLKFAVVTKELSALMKTLVSTAEFYVLLTVHLGIILVSNQLDAQFFLYVYFCSLHVSSNPVLIIRRITCINTTSGICHSV